MSRTHWHAAALALYAALAWMLLDQGESLTSHVLGYGADPSLVMWFLAWWPWAVSHHVASLTTHLVWQPAGLNLGWTTSVPLLALLGAPATLLGGPLLGFNLLALAAPALAAWAAYFLCLELGALPGAALLGGLVFGYSSFEAAQSFDHLNLDFCALIPLILLVVLRRVRGLTGRVSTSVWLGLLLGGECLISEEILATTCLFGSIAWALAWVGAPAYRRALRALVLDALCAAPLALALATPLLLAMVFGPHDIAHPANWSALFAIDALNFVIPTQSTWVGGNHFTALSSHFAGGLDEQTGYLGGLLLLVLALLCDAGARRRLWLPLAMFGIVMLASLGVELNIAGRATGIPLPWALVAHLPLLGEALPARCMLYAGLLGAILLSLFVTTRRRALLGCLIALSLLPVPRSPQPSPALVFFQPGQVRMALGGNPRLLILPFAIAGKSSYWQAESGFAFTQVGGYLGYPPDWAQSDPAVMQLFSNTFLPGFIQDFAKLCHLRGVQYVVAAPGTPEGELAALAALDWRGQKIDDVTVFTVPTP